MMTFRGFLGWIGEAFNRLACAFTRHPEWMILEGQPLTDEERDAFEANGFECVPVTESVAVCTRCGAMSVQEKE